MSERTGRERSAPASAQPRLSATDDRDLVAGLVQRTLAGDDDAYAEIFKRFRDKVYRICFRFTGDHDETMDLVQTVFIKVHRSLASYREESSFSTWIARVATNVGIDHVRLRKREGRVELDEEMEDDVAVGAEAIAPRSGLDPAAAALNAELGVKVREAIEGLSEKHRTVFNLHCVEGMPYQTIADTLRISIGTVMSRLFHARRNLRKALTPYLDEVRVRALLRGQDEPTRGRPGEAARME